MSCHDNISGDEYRPGDLSGVGPDGLPHDVNLMNWYVRNIGG